MFGAFPLASPDFVKASHIFSRFLSVLSLQRHRRRLAFNATGKPCKTSTAGAMNKYVAHKGGASPLFRVLGKCLRYPAGCVAFFHRSRNRPRRTAGRGPRRAISWAAVLGITAFAGCASGPSSLNDRAERQYRRADAKVEAIDSLELLEKACNARGGMVQMRRTHGRFPLTVADVESATCM